MGFLSRICCTSAIVNGFLISSPLAVFGTKICFDPSSTDPFRRYSTILATCWYVGGRVLVWIRSISKLYRRGAF
jgi:hypothetical protein